MTLRCNSALTVKCLRQWSHPSPLRCTWAEPQTSATKWKCSFQNCEYIGHEIICFFQYLIVILCFLLLCKSFANSTAIYKLQIPCSVTRLLQLANRELQIPSAVATITNYKLQINNYKLQNTNYKSQITNVRSAATSIATCKWFDRLQRLWVHQQQAQKLPWTNCANCNNQIPFVYMNNHNILLTFVIPTNNLVQIFM